LASTTAVVTFSQAQQRLIEDMLDEQLRHRPELEHFFSADKIKPIFVKNLENVQGDECDMAVPTEMPIIAS
jgi:superfamily I DNA and/or RNA helicase